MPSNVRTILLHIHHVTKFVNKTVHDGLSEGHSSVAPQKSQVQVPLCREIHRIGLQPRPLHGAAQIHVLKSGVEQGPQPASFHAHPRVHHFEKLSQTYTNRAAPPQTNLRTSVTLRLSRLYSPPTKVTWVLWGSPKGWGEGVAPHPFFSPNECWVPQGLDHHPRSHDAGFPILKKCTTRWSSHSTMPSEEEQQPGPSGISREELSPLSGLNVTNDDEEAIGEEEKEHPSCNQTKDDFDRQRTFQTQLLEQTDHTPQRSSRKRRQLKPGHRTLSLPKSKKRRSIVQIRNTDVLCYARALVTAKAKVDRHPKWRSFRDGTGKIQKEHALLLHYEANVPFGPCGYEEFIQFSQAPSLFDYQILLVDAHRAFYITSFGSPAPDKQQLVLLHEKGHYDVITSLPAWKR